MMHALAEAGEFDKDVFRVLTDAALSSVERVADGRTAFSPAERLDPSVDLLLLGCPIAVLADWAWSLDRSGLKEVCGRCSVCCPIKLHTTTTVWHGYHARMLSPWYNVVCVSEPCNRAHSCRCNGSARGAPTVL